MSMFYDGWRDITVVWADGTEEVIQALGRPDPYVRDGILHLRVSDDDKYRHIPLASIREWRTRDFR
jgi:hypothetical protein